MRIISFVLGTHTISLLSRQFPKLEQSCLQLPRVPTGQLNTTGESQAGQADGQTDRQTGVNQRLYSFIVVRHRPTAIS